jgi:hypothetical protein
MHPAARVSIKYWKNLRTQQSIFSARWPKASTTYRGNTKRTHKKITHDALRRRQLILTLIYGKILEFAVSMIYTLTNHVFYLIFTLYIPTQRIR